MAFIGPDDLQEGKTYRFQFHGTDGKPVPFQGVYKGSDFEDYIWFNFFDPLTGNEVPFVYSDLNQLEEVTSANTG